MLKYLAKRVGRSILTLFIIVTLVFCLLRLMPVEGYFANYEKMTEVQIQAGLQSMGLLDPLPVQIVRFWKGDKKDPVRPKPYRAFENITSWSVQNEICFM